LNKTLITLGEPAGIGPDLCVMLAKNYLTRNTVVIADPFLIESSSKVLKKKVNLNILDDIDSKTLAGPSTINVLPINLRAKNMPGKLNPKNAGYVIETIKKAADLCLMGKANSMVTGPISKSVLNDGGYKISGHTEFLANICKHKSVMMLMNSYMKVALHTTHVPLQNVHKYITIESIKKTIGIVHADLQNKFGIKKPKILVTGLNPHAGEDGMLGEQDAKIIRPAITEMRKKKIVVEGPVPADTAFLKKYIESFDIILTMYHDQGLPVIKFNNFKKTVNVTLGLPITRVSVDHGTALDLVGSGNIDISSFVEAIRIAKFISNAQS